MIGGTVLLLLLTALLPGQPDFSAPGRFRAAFRTVDIPGGTELMRGSRIYYPESAKAIPRGAAPAPIVVFGHGWLMGIDRYYSYAEHLATWGYVVVLPTISNPIVRAEHDKRARLMADAARFAAALDTVTGDPFFHRLATARWGFCGHSMGGGLALLAAGTLSLDDTLKVVVAMASPQTDPPVRPAQVAVPRLVVAGGNDNIAPWRDVRATMWQDAAAPGTFAVIRGANHGHFMDFSYPWENGGTAGLGREQQQRSARRLLTARLERSLHANEGDWDFAWLYGDSLSLNPAYESVETRVPMAAAREQAGRRPPQLAVLPNPFTGAALLSGYTSENVLVYDAAGNLVGVCVGPAVGGELGPGVYFLRSARGDRQPVRIVKAR